MMGVHIIYDPLTGETKMIYVEDEPVVEEVVPQITLEEQVKLLKSRLDAAEQASADNSITQQELLELLIDLGVI